eukprot:7888533-Pyramimonas_sp.AAC.1
MIVGSCTTSSSDGGGGTGATSVLRKGGSSVTNTGLGINWVSNGLWIHSSTFWSSGQTWGSN